MNSDVEKHSKQRKVGGSRQKEETRKIFTSSRNRTGNVQSIERGGVRKRKEQEKLHNESHLEEFKIQAEDEKASFNDMFSNEKGNESSQQKLTIFTAAKSSMFSLSPSTLINTDFWTLSYTKPAEKSTAKTHIISAIRTAVYFSLEQIPALVSLAFLDNTPNSIFPAALGISFVFTYGFIQLTFSSLGRGVQTLITQANQEKRVNMAVNIFKKAIVMMTLAIMPFAVGWAFLSGTLTQLLVSNQQLSSMVNSYCTYALPSTYLSGIYFIFRGFFESRGESWIPLFSVTASAVSSLIWNLIFVKNTQSNMNQIIGAAVARNLTEVVNVIILVGLLVLRHHKDKQFSFRLSKMVFKGWVELLKFCAPFSFSYIVDWLNWNLFMITATQLPINQLNAHAVMSIFSWTYCAFAKGIAHSFKAQVNSAMATNNLRSALNNATIGIVVILIYLIVTITPLAFLQNWFFTFLRIDHVISNEISSLYILFLTSLTINSLLPGVSSVPKAIGRTKVSFAITISSFLVLGQVLANIFINVNKGGLAAVWLSILAASTCSTIALLIISGLTDWEKQAKNVFSVINDQQHTLHHRSVMDSLLITPADYTSLKQSLLQEEDEQIKDSKEFSDQYSQNSQAVAATSHQLKEGQAQENLKKILQPRSQSANQP